MTLRAIVGSAVAAGVVFLAAGLHAAEPPSVEAPKVLAGDYVDTSSMEGIVEGIFRKPGLTDEQKVISFYHWYRRVVYPYRYMASDRRDVLKQINTAGFALCGSQAAVCSVILRAAGYETRALSGDGGPEWGHTFWEVKYGDRWHLFDAMTAFYVLTRDNPPHVASGDEIEADPTLVTKAVEEKRCGPEFLYTSRKHEITLEERERFQQETKGEDVPWSLLVTKPGSLLEYWTKVAEKKRIKVQSNDTLGGKYTPGVHDITLKANERYVRCWTGLGKWMAPPSFVTYSPANMAAGDNEHFDVVNFKYFEPYRQARPNPFNEAVYRTYGNGWLEWAPTSSAQLTQGQAQTAGLKELTNSDRNRGFVIWSVEDTTKAASLTLPVKSPYAVVEIELATSLPKDAVASLTLTPMADGKAGAAKKLWASNAPPSTAPDAPMATARGDLTTIVVPLTAVAPPIYEYQLKLELAKAAGGTIGFKRLKTTFQLAPMALPGLVPGANKIRVTSAKPGKLQGGKLVVTYAWFDAPDYKAEKMNVKELAELPAEYEIALPPGDKLPKMRSLEMFLSPSN